MRLFVSLLAFCALLATAGCVLASEAPKADIRVEGGGWEQVPPESIEKTLYAVAEVLLPHLPNTLDAPIVVTHTSGPPVALYERGPHGEYLVQLHASGPRWHLYVYEFAHELTHILSNYERNAGPQQARHNQWLEESLCETASLFVLDRLAAAWMQAPPGDEFAARGAGLRRFFDALVGEAHRRLPGERSFAAWLADHEPRLRADPYQRKHDDLVARYLLPLFERNPGGWAALRYLNLDKADSEATLAQYLGHWYRNAPPTHKPFVGAVLDALAVAPSAS